MYLDTEMFNVYKKFDMIVATDLNWGIGHNNRLLVSAQQDMEFFKAFTLNKVVIMGRKTAESLPHKYLRNRINIIVSHSFGITEKIEYPDDNSVVVKLNSIDSVLKYLETNYLRRKPHVVIGGRSIYLEFLQRELIDRIFLTTYFKKFDNVDTYIPDLLTIGFSHNLKNPYHVITGYEVPQKAIINKRQTNLDFSINTLTI